MSIALEQASSSGYITEGGDAASNNHTTNQTTTFSSVLTVPSPGVASRSAPHSRSGSVKTRGSRRGRGGGGGGAGGDDGRETPEFSRSRNGSIDLDDTVIAQLERIKALQTDDLCPVGTPIQMHENQKLAKSIFLKINISSKSNDCRNHMSHMVQMVV